MNIFQKIRFSYFYGNSGKFVAQLSSENRFYFDEFLKTLSSALMLGGERTAVPEFLSTDVLSDLLQAQKDEKSALEYFGMPASELAVNMAKEAPRSQYLPQLIFGPIFIAPALILAVLKIVSFSFVFGVIWFASVDLSRLVIDRYFTKWSKNKRLTLKIVVWSILLGLNWGIAIILGAF